MVYTQRIGRYIIRAEQLTAKLYKITVEDPGIDGEDKVIIDRAVDYADYGADRVGIIARAITPAPKDRVRFTAKDLKALLKPMLDGVAKKVSIKGE